VVTLEAGMTELDLSGNHLDMADAMAVVMALPKCNMLKKLTFSGEKAAGVTLEAGMTEVDLSGTRLGAAGAAVVAGFLPRCTALASANLLCNDFGTEQAVVLAAVVKGHGTLVSVCGLWGSETAVDMSGRGLGAGDVVLLAGELATMEVLTKLNLSNNNIFGTHVPPTGKKFERYDFGASAVSFLVNACRLATLQQLELASNNMNASAAQQLGNGLRLLKEAGTLGPALRCIKLHDNPLAHGDQDREGCDSTEHTLCRTHSSFVASSWERSIDGLQSLLKFVRGSVPLELADMNEEAILKDLEEGRWRGQ
jgi:hypothetical protein